MIQLRHPRKQVEPVSRLLPLAVAQVPPVPLTGARPGFADQVAALMDDFPNTRLAIYPLSLIHI